jgi:5'-nucleotidase / UDP-sugar diphosphatase
MKHFKYFVVIVLFFLGGNIFPQVDTLTILHFNDTHSCLAPLGPRDQNLEGTIGGIARAASFIGLTKMTDPNVLTLMAGDFSIGDLFYNVYFGAAELQIYNSLGVDAVTLGNHEFDLGPSTLYQALQGSFAPNDGFPLLSTNLVLPDQTVRPLAEYVKPYKIKQVGNIKVGIFGLTTPETNLLSSPGPAVLDTNILIIAADYVDTLTSNNCDVIILLSHLGYKLDQAIASLVPGINIIVGGHDHLTLQTPTEVLNPSGKTTWIVQAKSHYEYIGKMQLGVEGGSVTLLDYQLVPMDENIPEEPTVKGIVNGLITEIEITYGPVYTQQIGYTDSLLTEEAVDLTNTGFHDTPVGDLVTDAFRWKTNADIAIEPGGSIAMPLQGGPIVGADLFRCLGYGFNTDNGLGFRLVKFDMTGAALVAGLEFGVSSIEKNDEFFIQVSGMEYVYNSNLEPGSRIESVLIGGKQLNSDSIYTVTTNEFVPMVLDQIGIPFSNLYTYEGLSEFEVLSEYVMATGPEISSPELGRINNSVSGIEENFSSIPRKFILQQNYPNPFNPSTTIQYTLSQQEKVKLVVYDILGKEIRTLVNESQSPGTYNVVFNAGSFASGVYFYSITAGTFHQIKKMMLLK